MATEANRCKTGLMNMGIGDRLAIHELPALHGHLMDDGELDELGLLSTDHVTHGLHALGAGTLQGIDAIRTAALRLGAHNPVAHQLTNVVLSESDGIVSARSQGLGVRTDGTVGSASHHDALPHTPAGWRIARRGVSPRVVPLTP